VGLGAGLVAAVSLSISCGGNPKPSQTGEPESVVDKRRPVTVPPKNTVILVRGGAMTAFTLDAMWSPPIDPSHPVQSQYCVDVAYDADLSSITFVNHADPAASTNTWTTLDSGWYIYVKGQSTGHAGLIFKPQETKCNNATTGKSITVMSTATDPENPTPGPGKFYPNKLNVVKHRKDNRRFMLQSGSGDEDLDERMWKIIVKVGSKEDSGSADCGDGDCSIFIGPP
jgi:hypothetical protein